jgi:hypothetical protein
MAFGRLLLFFLGWIFLPHAYGAELLGPEIGVIPYGMGRAYTAVADDWLALSYNPAGLAMVKSVDLQLFDIQVGTSRGVAKGYTNISRAAGDGIATILQEFAGRNVLASVGNHSQLTIPNFAIAMNYDVMVDMYMQNQAYPQTLTRYTKDLTFSAGAAYGFGTKKNLRVGAKIDFTHRTGGTRFLTLDEIASDPQAVVNSFKGSGNGIGGTLGMQYTIPDTGPTEVTTSFVWYDIGATSYGGVSDSNRPTRKEDSMTAGLALRFPIGGQVNRRYQRRYGTTRANNHLTFAFDYSHLNLSTKEEQFMKHVHLGMNLDLPIMSVQLGLNQTSLTYGAAVDLGILRLAASTYAEELGSYSGQNRDRRYLLSISSSLGFGGL